MLLAGAGNSVMRVSPLLITLRVYVMNRNNLPHRYWCLDYDDDSEIHVHVQVISIIKKITDQLQN